MSLFSKLFKCQVKNELPVVNSKENEIEKVSPAIELSGAEKIKEVGNFIVNSPIVVQNRNMHNMQTRIGLACQLYRQSGRTVASLFRADDRMK